MFTHIRKLNYLSPASLKLTTLPIYSGYRAVSTGTSKKWDLWSSVCIERHPIITAPMQPIEIKFQNFLTEIERDNSYKSDHEMRVEFDKTQNNTEIIDQDAPVKQLAQDFEEASQAEFDQFTFAPRSVETDNTDVQRYKMDQNLLLVIHQKLGNNQHWIPPQGKRNSDETMRQAAERILRDTCGEELKVEWYGNAPIGYFKYRYPSEVAKNGAKGAKVFCFLAKYINGSIKKDTKHQWLEMNGLKNVLPEKIYNCTSQFLWNC